MSTLNKKTLALALVAALGAAANASAYELSTDGDQNPVLVATADLINASTVVGIDEALQLELDADGTDSILGRTTGFSVRIQLSNGAQFAPGFLANDTAASDVVIGPAGNNPNKPGTPANSEWTVSTAAGGANQSFVVLSINPPSTIPVPGLVEGLLLQIDPAATVIPAAADDNFQLDNLVPYLSTAGRVITATVTFTDPVSGNPITGMDPQSTPVLMSGNPLLIGCDASTALNPDETIDVGETVTQDSKTFFSSTGEIGLTDTGVFNAGSITVEINPGFTSFQYLNTDNFRTVVTGVFSAFDGASTVYLASDPTCATTLVTGTLNAARTTVTFDYDGTDLGGNFSNTGFDVSLCFEVPNGNAQIIDASTVSVVTSFQRGLQPIFTAPVCNLLPLRYNGSVVKVATFNPAANATAQSFLRVTNPSSTAGQVTIDAWDDNGNYEGPITFMLPAGVSRQINSDTIENGGAGFTGSLGDGVGKWRFLVTGEFAGMRVQSLNRNNTDGTVTNLTDYDTNSEQSKNLFFGTVSTYEGSDPN